MKAIAQVDVVSRDGKQSDKLSLLFTWPFPFLPRVRTCEEEEVCDEIELGSRYYTVARFLFKAGGQHVVFELSPIRVSNKREREKLTNQLLSENWIR